MADFYSDETIRKVKERADIRQHVPDADTSRRTSYVKCPQCGKVGKRVGLCVTHTATKDIAKCFDCGFEISGAINAEMYYSGSSFQEAIKKVAMSANVVIESENERKKRLRKEESKKQKGTFCSRQLEESGLDVSDVMATVRDAKGNEYEVATFRKGGFRMPDYKVNFDEDDMIIFYYDLYGEPMKYATRGAAGGLKDLVRVRHQFPESNVNAEGKQKKYESPAGAEARFFFPQIIRAMFQKGQEIETLIIQEGEKKAIKACKHGILSIAIQGIYNIGNEKSGLIKDLQFLVQKCNIKNVVLLFDSDWNDLSKNLHDRDSIDSRPNQFAKAAIKFRNYVETINHSDISVDVYFGHINGDEKGIDDLLTGSLKGKEYELKEDMEATMLTHDGKGKFADIHKISTLSDFKIMDFWKLRDREAFFELHRERLAGLKKVKFGKVLYVRDGDEFKQSGKANADNEFWVIEWIEEKDKRKKNVTFDTLEALSFLEGNGFARIHTKDQQPGEFHFIQNTEGIIRKVGASNIRDFAYGFTMQNCKDRDVLIMMAEKLGKYLGVDRLERLKITDDNFDKAEPYRQYLIYRNGMATITANEITFGPMMGMAWDSKVIKRPFKRIPIFKEFEKTADGDFDFEVTPDGSHCEFLKFIRNTSTFKKESGEPDENDMMDHRRHVANKLTAIGFLLTDFKFLTELKCVVAMDAKLDEVAVANGRSGKSLISDAIRKMINCAWVDCKKQENVENFMFNDVDFETRNVHLDDVRINFDFESIYAAITGDLTVNVKGGRRFNIKKEESPKFFITTNHAIKDSTDSGAARIAYISFSDYYNKDYTPIMDFGHSLFDQWDEYQWLLFDNLMAECIMLYMRSMVSGWAAKGNGIVPPPMKDIKARSYRQQMGEAFFQWAESFFALDGSNINMRLDRKDMYDNFLRDYPNQKNFVSTQGFKSRLKAYCAFTGLALNAHRLDVKGRSYNDWCKNRGTEDYFCGDLDKANGHEYFTITTDFYSKINSK